MPIDVERISLYIDLKAELQSSTLGHASRHPNTIPHENIKHTLPPLLRLAQKPSCDIPNVCHLQLIILPDVRINANVIKC